MSEILEKGEAGGFAELRERIATWRKTRVKLGPMPEELWKAAGKLAKRHGINPTAKALGVQYYGLKERIEREAPVRGGRGRPPRKVAFVEVPRLAAAPASLNTMEIERPGGTKVTLRLSSAVDVVAVLESVWRTER